MPCDVHDPAGVDGECRRCGLALFGIYGDQDTEVGVCANGHDGPAWCEDCLEASEL